VKTNKPFLFEVSWEVCNKIGGIYTVLESKSDCMESQYEDNYFLIGPFLGESSFTQFEPKELPDFLKKAEEELKKVGIEIHYGRWLIGPEPQVILVDFKNYLPEINKIKETLWDWYGIDSITASFDFNEPVAWSWAVGKFLEIVKNDGLKNQKTIVHCHEWLAGTAILYLKKVGSDVATVFTTHATFLGRVLASAEINFYKDIDKINPDQKAKELGIVPKHLLEKTIALSCNVLTTVSEITAIEAEHFYGRKPEVILHNGLNFKAFPDTEEITFKHTEYKRIIKEFIMYYFFPYYKFNLDKTLIYFLVSRYEMHAKGIDLFIDSLSELNKKLKAQNSEKTIIAFLSVPTAVNEIRPEIVQSKAIFSNIKQLLESEMQSIQNRLLRACTGEFKIADYLILEKELKTKIYAKIKQFNETGEPALCTHNLRDNGGDAILNRLKDKGLTNSKDDRVKVVSIPVYLNGSDGLLDINLYDFIAGSHFGVFPSFYEPWGYTPLEAGALGVPSVTSDLSGFGFAVNNLGKPSKLPGSYVLKRTDYDYEKELKDLTSILYKYTTFNKDERLLSRIHANQVAKNYSWKILSKNYFEAHELALKLAGGKK
jgi:glycogen(starch) synthase